MTDFWEGMTEDPDAIARIKKSVKLLDCKEGMIVLDIGCHKMEAIKYLPKNIHYCGIDSENNGQQVVADIDGGFVFPKQVDRILCLEVLEHLEMPGGVLQTIQTVLKDDGVAVVSLPNEATLFHRIRCLFGTVDAECFNYGGKHLHLPSLKQSRRFLEEFFEILEVRFYTTQVGIGVKPQWVAWLMHLAPYRVLQLLATLLPSLFARGFIFKLKRKLH